MLLTIVGLALSTIAASFAIHFSVISKKWGKPLLITLTIFGFFTALFSAMREEDLKNEERTKADIAITKLRLIETKTDFIELAVGDLAALKKLSGNTKFYVRIAASDKPNESRCSGTLTIYVNESNQTAVEIRPRGINRRSGRAAPCEGDADAWAAHLSGKC
jgi:hypothetical protein